jgi:cytochrome c
VAIAQGHRSADATAQFANALRLIEGSDCKACHSMEKKSIGPAYKAVALKYKQDNNAAERLAKKVIAGGSGVWGEVSMSAHPQLAMTDAKEMVRYILSLADEKAAGKALPPAGNFTTALPPGDQGVGVYLLRAAYQDKGANGIGSSTSEENLMLRNPNVLAASADKFEGIQKYKMPNGPTLVLASGASSTISFDKTDLTGLDQLTFTVMAVKEAMNAAGGIIEVHVDGPGGKLIGKSAEIVAAETPIATTAPQQVKVSLNGVTGYQNLYFVFKNPKAGSGQVLFALINILFQSTDKSASN